MNTDNKVNHLTDTTGHVYNTQPPTKTFRFAAVGALLIGSGSFALGLFNADMLLNEKGYYLATLLFGLFSAVSVQKSVRDRLEGIKTSNIYYILSWIAVSSAIGLLCVGFYYADLMLSEKGFFGIAFLLSLFAAVTVQKNVRDIQVDDERSELNNYQKAGIHKLSVGPEDNTLESIEDGANKG